MQYRLKGKTIASELSAKPPSRASRHLASYLRTRPAARHVLDYGCGKLRYSAVLGSRGRSVTLVDSSSQLDRQQRIDGAYTTVREVADSLENARIETIEQFQVRQWPRFDFALCANVLSAIPSKKHRDTALRAIFQRLRRGGELLVVNQHTNSHYTLAVNGKVQRHLDGWLISKTNLASYYGMLDRNKSARLLRAAGFQILKHWIHDQSNYALVRKP